MNTSSQSNRTVMDQSHEPPTSSSHSRTLTPLSNKRKASFVSPNNVNVAKENESRSDPISKVPKSDKKSIAHQVFENEQVAKLGHPPSTSSGESSNHQSPPQQSIPQVEVEQVITMARKRKPERSRSNSKVQSKLFVLVSLLLYSYI